MTSDVGNHLESYVLDEFDHAARLLAGQSVGHGGIHGARKSIRRARAALRLARKVLGDAAGDALDVSGEIGANLASLRDAHVAVTTLSALAAQSAARDERELLRRVGRVFATRRSALYAESRARGTIAYYRGQLRDLRAALERLPWRKVTAHALREALDHDIRRAGRIGARADASADGDLRHRWRRRLRRLRYELKAAAQALGRRPEVHSTWSWPARRGNGRRCVSLAVRPEVLRGLTDRLGREHDLRMVYAALRAAEEIDRSDRSAARRVVRRAIAAVSGPLGRAGA